jgi:hypothetical protein
VGTPRFLLVDILLGNLTSFQFHLGAPWANDNGYMIYESWA